MIARALLRVAAAMLVLVVIAALAGLVVVQSGWFHEYVRQRIIAEIERATGGRVELGRFSFRGPTLTATAAPLVLHGAEGPGEPPLLRVESVTIGLRIISWAERRIDLASIKIEKPQAHIVINADGSTNLPSAGHSGNWAVEVINLAVGHYEISDGMVELEERSIPINLRGEGLAIKLDYDPRTPSYLGELSSRGLRVAAPGTVPVEFGFSTRFALEKSKLKIAALHLATRESHADLSGDLANPISPSGVLKVQASVSVHEAAAMFPIPLAPAGSADFTGTLEIAVTRPSDFALAGRVNARGLGYSSGRLHVEDARARAQIEVASDGVAASDIEADALGAHFTGKAGLANWKRLHAEGDLEGLSVTQAAGTVTPRQMPWNGTLAGTFMADLTLGESDARGSTNLAITPAEQGTPIQGQLDASYDQRAGELTLGESYIATPSSRLDASGTLGRRMDVRVRSTNIGDVRAVLPLLEEGNPVELPMGFKYGSIEASGAVTGPLNNPDFRGQVSVTKGSIEGHGFDTFNADVDLSKASLFASRFTVARGPASPTQTSATGTATLTANQGNFEDAAVTAQFAVRNANVEELAKEAGGTVAVQGTASATVRMSGTLRDPQADLTVNVANPRALGESADRLTAALKLTRHDLEVSSGEADEGLARITFSGAYHAATPNWSSGDVQLQAATRNLPLSRVQAAAALDTGIEATITSDVRAQGRVADGAVTLGSAAGTVAAQAVTIHGEPLGELTLTVQTSGQEVSVEANGKIDAASLDGKGAWRLDRDENGSATLHFTRVNLDEAHRLGRLFGIAPQEAESNLPLEGFVDGGSVAVTLALRHPRDFQASVTLNAVQFNPRPGQSLGLGVQPQDLVLKSAQPVTVDLNAKEARIQPVRLTGLDTNLEVGGTVPFTAGAGGTNISVRGAVNLVALQLLNSNLLARGNAQVEATLRGALADPALNGRMDLKDASLYLKDEPTGLDNVNGGVVFSRNRATIDKLTADVGSGTVALRGFVEFATPLIYRLQAAAQQIRVRLPIDLSTNFSANLALDGTSDASTLSGTLTLNRAAFNPRTDIGQLLDAFSAPVPETAPNDYLRGMQFDVRVTSSPTFELQTTLTRDVQADVDLRVRGTPVRPLMFGSISVNSGQVQVFGTQYTIDRGDIRFTNPIKIEPVFDLALETKVSGVSVSVSMSGPIDKLKTNYSSDPPLESSKIVALLAVGRDPNQYPGAASAAATASSTNFVGAGGSLLSEALSEQLSSKLQRFFGATRVKIDPTMTGIDNTPQARLTFEQQVSKDVTMTYITNLNYTQEQIVRLQWDLTPKWSAIAVRDANGLFGIDFEYRRRFK